MSRPMTSLAISGPVRTYAGVVALSKTFAASATPATAFRRGVRYRDVTAGREGAVQPGDEAGRIGLVGDEVQDRQKQDRHGLTEVDKSGQLSIGEDDLGLAQVRLDDGRVRHGVQHVPAVRQHHRVVVDVDDPHIRAALAGHLVGVGRRGQARPDVDDLPDLVSSSLARAAFRSTPS